MTLYMGFDDEEWGTATLKGGELLFAGDDPNRVRKYLERGEERGHAGEALLRWADRFYRGRCWASLEERVENAEAHPPEDREIDFAANAEAEIARIAKELNLSPQEVEVLRGRYAAATTGG